MGVQQWARAVSRAGWVDGVISGVRRDPALDSQLDVVVNRKSWHNRGMAVRSFRMVHSQSPLALIVDVISLLAVLTIFFAVIYSLIMAASHDPGYYVVAALVFAGGSAVGWKLLTNAELQDSADDPVPETWPPR
jgi:hypothetical protein